MGPVDVSLALAVFHQRHPDVELTVREQSSEELAEMLRDDVLDLAFLSVTERMESHGLGLQQLVSEELVVVLPCDHPLAGRDDADGWPSSPDEHFISYREGARLRELLDLRGTPRRLRAADQARVQRERADPAAWWPARWVSRSSPAPMPSAPAPRSRWPR